MLKKLVMGVLGFALCGLAMAAEWNLQPAASKVAADSHWLHEAIVVLVLVLFVGVFGFMFWSCYAHRKSVGHKAANFHQHLGVEIAWTAIPLIILVSIAWPVTKTVIAQKDTSNTGISVNVTGFEWKWDYDHPQSEGEGIGFVSTLSTSREVMKFGPTPA